VFTAPAQITTENYSRLLENEAITDSLFSTVMITVALQRQVRQFGNNIDVLAPGAFVSMIIPLAVFFAFQRQFVSGVMAGAVK
jgi:ABC-type glycerol-3-phosphate transport system permease component